MKPGDVVIAKNIPDVFRLRDPGIIIAIDRSCSLYAHLLITASHGWIFQERQILDYHNYARIESAPNIKDFIGRTVWWYPSELVEYAPAIEVYFPDGKKTDIVVAAEAGYKFQFNNVQYMVDEVSMDKCAVWVEEIK